MARQKIDVLFSELESISRSLADAYRDLAVVEFAEINARSAALARGLNSGQPVNATERLADIEARDHRLEATKIRGEIRALESERDFLTLQINHGYHDD